MKTRLPWLLLLSLLAALLLPREAAAQSNDEPAKALVDRAMKVDLAQKGVSGKSLALLQLAKKICAKDCSVDVRAQIAVGFGTVHAYQGKTDEAVASFKEALALKPDVTLVKGRDAKPVVDAFEKAKKGDAPKEPEKPAPAPAPAPEPAEPVVVDTRKTVEECEGQGAAPQGWKSYKAFCYFSEAVAAEAGQEWVPCADYASRSFDEDGRSTTRYLGAQCNERGGRWTAALKDYQEVVSQATAEGKKATAAEAGTRAKLLRERIPRLILQPPAGVENLKVQIDGKELSEGQIGGEVWVDPGQREVTAQGTLAGAKLEFRQLVTVQARQTKTVEITQGTGGAIQDQAVMKCMLEAKTKDEIAACLKRGEESAALNLLVALEISAYHDTDAVDVLTPGVVASLESPTGGWGVGGSFLIDVVTAASADIVATASPRWTEVRYVPAINGHAKFGDTDIRLNGSASVEPDYLALGAGLGFSTDLAEKMITPALSYDFGYDISGRAGTPFSVYGKKIHRHGITGSVTFVLDKASIFVPTLTSVFEFGDTSKPYRYLPLFDPNTEVLVGETIDSVNAKRLPGRVAEQLPTNRQRYAAAGLYARRFSTVTFRLEERLYLDSWGVMASTTDFLLPNDFTESFRLWPHLRFHAQSGAKFYQLAYTATEAADGRLDVPKLRTGDRELGPMLTGTAGLGSRIEFGENNSMALQLTADAMYTRFLDHLFVRGRFGVFGAATVEALFE